jgi:hypothetical protein
MWAGPVAGPIEYENKIWSPLWGLEGFKKLRECQIPWLFCLELVCMQGFYGN